MLENEKQIHISSVVLEYQELVNSLFGPYIGHSCTNETKGYKSKPDSSILNIIRKCTTQPIIQLLAEYLKKNSQLTGNFTGFLTIIFYPHIIQFLKAFNSRLTILINKDNYIHTHKSLVFYKCYEKLKLMPIEPLELTNDVIDFLESILGFIQNELHTISHMLCGNSDLESVKIARCSIYACFDIYGYISTIIGNSLSASMTNEQAIDITSYLTEEHVIYINKAVVRITTICTEKTWVDPDFISSMWFNHTVSHYINMWMTLIDITSHVIDDNPKFVTNCFNVIDTDIKIYLEFWSLSQPAILHAVIKILFILLNHCNDRLEALNTKLINGMNENMMKIIAIIIFYSKTIGNMMTTVCKYINDNILFHGYLAIPVTHLLIKTVKMSRSSNCSEFDSIDNLKLFNICFLALENLLTIYLFNFNYHNDTSRLINDFRHIYMILIEESGGESHFQIFMLRLFLNKILEENNLLVLDSNIIGIVCEIIESITSNKVPIDRMNSNFFPDLSSEHTGKLQSNIINYLTFPCDLFTLLIISLLKNSFYCNCLITLLFAWSKSCSPLHMLLSEVIWRSLGEFYSRNYNDSSYIIILDALLILCLESDAETYFNIESELEKFISLQLVLPPSQQHLFACLKQFLSSFDIRHPVADLLLRDVIMPYMNSIRQSLRPIISDHVYDNIGIDKEEICHHKQHKSIFHISFISSNADNDGCMSEMDRFLINKTNHLSNHAIKYGPSFTLFLNLYRSIPNGWFQAILLNIDQSDSDLDNLEGTISSYVDSLDNGSTIGTRKYIACIAKTVNALFVTIADYIKTLYQNGNYQKTIVLLCLCNQLLLAQSEIYPKIFIFDTKQLIFYFAILG